MILVLLGTQNNSFYRLLEEIEKNIEKGIIKEKVIVQAGFTKFDSNKLEIFDMAPQDELEKLIEEASLVISHGGVGSMMSAIKKGKKVIAVPRLKKYKEHVNDHQIEIIETFKNQGLIIGINGVEELEEALEIAKSIKLEETKLGTNNIVKIIDQFIQDDIKKRKNNN